jgi:hypothetical protein
LRWWQQKFYLSVLISREKEGEREYGEDDDIVIG